MTKPHIDKYSFGEITIDNLIYRKDVIITLSEVLPNWRREKGHVLSMADLEGVLQIHPQIILIGTGFYGRVSIADSIIQGIKDMGIQLISHKTTFACRIYNELSNEKEVIAGLHLTC